MVVLRVSSVSLSAAFTMNESWTVRVGMDLFVSSSTTAITKGLVFGESLRILRIN